MPPGRVSGGAAISPEERAARGKTAGIADARGIERRRAEQALRATELQSLDVRREALAIARAERAAEVGRRHAVTDGQLRGPRRVLPAHAVGDVPGDVDLPKFPDHRAMIGDRAASKPRRQQMTLSPLCGPFDHQTGMCL